MKINKTKIKGLLVIKGVRHTDKRGYLRELLLEKKINKKFKFHITSFSKKNVLRGLHFQIKKPQGKFISVIRGEIFDTVVDIRKKSKTFGKSFSVKLSEKNCTSLYIPPGSTEKSLFYKDPKLKIKWPIKNPIVSNKDKKAKKLEFYINNLF